MFFQIVLELRQRRALQLPTPPRSLAEHIPDHVFSKSKAYNLDKLRFRVFEKVVMTILGLYFLQTDAMANFWYRVIGNLALVVPEEWRNETVHSIFFVCLYYVFDQMINIPFSVYSTFVIEQR